MQLPHAVPAPPPSGPSPATLAANQSLQLALPVMQSEMNVEMSVDAHAFAWTLGVGEAVSAV
jgi:hypothetical protein